MMTSPCTISYPSYSNRVNHIFKIVVELDKLLEACDTTAALQMPKTIGLIKQLKKELNLPKILDSFKTRKGKQ